MRPTELDDLRESPEDLGLVPGRLQRVGSYLDGEIADGRLPGAVWLIARRGRVADIGALGRLDPASGAPMRLDAIFRIYSLTKSMMAAVALHLVESGSLALRDPVSHHLSAFAVFDESEAVPSPGARHPTWRPEAAGKQMTVRDLLRHTSGLGGSLYGDPVLARAYERAGIVEFDHDENAAMTTLDELVERLSSIPLRARPGTVWEYGRSGDVLGAVLQAVAGRPLDELAQETLFNAAGMTSTGFWVAPEEHHRVASPAGPYQPAAFTERPAFLSAGSGLYSTLGDLFRFASLLLDGGRSLEGGDVLSRAAVASMTADHLGPLRGTGLDFIPGDGHTFGLGLAVRVDGESAHTFGQRGDVFWIGRATTTFFVSPAEEIVAVLLAQAYGPPSRYYPAIFRNLVLQALA